MRATCIRNLRFSLLRLGLRKSPAIFFGQPCVTLTMVIFTQRLRIYDECDTWMSSEKPKIGSNKFSCLAVKRGILCRMCSRVKMHEMANMKTKWTQRRWLYVTGMCVLVCMRMFDSVHVSLAFQAVVAYCVGCCRYRRTVWPVHCWFVFILNAFHTYRRRPTEKPTK